MLPEVSSSLFRHVAILGPGLLGGSVACAVKRFLPGISVSLWGRRQEPLDYAQFRQMADRYTTDIGEAVEDADLVILASPIGVMKPLAERFADLLPSGALVTDVGSVKGSVHRDLGAYLGAKNIDFIGSHPMAGSEKQGVEYASADLFMDACVVLTNDDDVCVTKLAALESFWATMGAKCISMQADEHDRLVAHVSHFPHSMAALCALTSAESINLPLAARLASTGFRDTTRVADGAPEMWAEILLENGDSLLTVLQQAQHNLASLAHLIDTKDKQALASWLQKAKEGRESIWEEQTD